MIVKFPDVIQEKDCMYRLVTAEAHRWTLSNTTLKRTTDRVWLTGGDDVVRLMRLDGLAVKAFREDPLPDRIANRL